MMSKITERPRVCFYGLYCYPLFNPKYNFQIGGWETRISLIAKELARRGNLDITMIVADYGQPHVEYRDGVQLISWMEKKGASPAEDEIANSSRAEASSGTNTLIKNQKEELEPYIRFANNWLHRHGFSEKTRTVTIYLVKELLGIIKSFLGGNLKALRILIVSPFRALIQLSDILGRTENLTRNMFGALDQNGFHIVWRQDVDIFDEVNADIYVVPGNHSMSAVAAYYCQESKKKYIFLAGSEYDYYPEYKTNPNGHDMYGESNFLKTYAIEHAALHIVQTQRQADMLEQGYGLDSIVIRNPINLNTLYPRSTAPEVILWVGKADERIKRPSLVLELARRLPNHPFVIILNKAVAEIYVHCLEEARSLPNVTLIEHVPFDEVESYFAAARLFVNTSVFEGFPNTFLQAAKYGVPIVSTDVDPNNMLSQHGCGIVCGGNFERFVENVQRLTTDDGLYTEMSAASLNYVRTCHDKDIIIAQVEQVFLEVLARG